MRGLTEEAAGVAIDVATRVLHLPTVRSSADELAAAAVRDRLTHRAYLAELLSAEVDDREECILNCLGCGGIVGNSCGSDCILIMSVVLIFSFH